MTQQFTHVQAQTSRFNSFVTGALTSTVIVLAAILSLAPYSLI